MTCHPSHGALAPTSAAPSGWCSMIRAWGRQRRCPCSPAVRSSDAIDAACPMHSVLMGQRMYCTAVQQQEISEGRYAGVWATYEHSVACGMRLHFLHPCLPMRVHTMGAHYRGRSLQESLCPYAPCECMPRLLLMPLYLPASCRRSQAPLLPLLRGC